MKTSFSSLKRGLKRYRKKPAVASLSTFYLSEATIVSKASNACFGSIAFLDGTGVHLADLLDLGARGRIGPEAPVILGQFGPQCHKKIIFEAKSPSLLRLRQHDSRSLHRGPLSDQFLPLTMPTILWIETHQP